MNEPSANGHLNGHANGRPRQTDCPSPLPLTPAQPVEQNPAALVERTAARWLLELLDAGIVTAEDFTCAVKAEHLGLEIRVSVRRQHAEWEQVAKPPTDAEQDILDVIREAGRRLTTAEVTAALDAANKRLGDSTIAHCLAELCQRKKLLTNRKDARGKGYGSADWN